MNLTMEHVISILGTLAVIAFIGIYSGRKVKSAADFDTAGKKAGWSIVMGTIVGTLVGAASTVATSQLAFVYGLSAWQYTLGSSTGALLLGIIFTRRLWKTNAKTVPEILSREYGPIANILCSIFVCLSLFISVIPQVIALSALLASMLKIGMILATVAAIVLMIVYVVFGGVWGTGLAGVAKITLIYFSMIMTGVVVTIEAGGISGFQSMFPPYPMFSIWGTRGIMSGIAGLITPILGVLASQTYIQAVMSGKDVTAGRVGAIVSFCLIPPIGFVSVLIGLFMKFHSPDISSAMAFPLFVLNYINPWFAGIILASILIATIGTGAGITLGMSTILTNDIYRKLIKPNATDKQMLMVSRVMIVFLLAITFAFTMGNLKTLMLQFTFLSMGLRATVAFLPLVFALFLAGKINRQWALMSMFLGPVGILGWKMFGNMITSAKIDQMYIGILVGAICMFIGLIVGEKQKSDQSLSNTGR